MKVPLQCQRPQSQARRCWLAVQVAPRVQQAVGRVQEPIYGVARARRLRVCISHLVVRPPRVQLVDHRLQWAAQTALRPFVQAPETLAKLPRRPRVVTMPDTFQDPLPQRAATTLTHFQDAMQKAKNQTHGRKQSLPSQARGRKTIGANRLRRVSGVEFTRLAFEFTLCGRQRLRRYVFGQAQAQQAAAPSRRRDADFRAVAPTDLFISDQLAWQAAGIFDRRADHGVTAQGQPQALPITRRAPEDVGQSLERHAELPQVERLLHFVSAPHAVGQSEGRTHRPNRPCGAQLEAAHDQVEFLETIRVMPVKTCRKLGGEQGRVCGVLRDEPGPKAGQVGQTSTILSFTGEGQNDMLLTHGWLRLGLLSSFVTQKDKPPQRDHPFHFQ
jgi:hypothetical protein